jgi:DNA invertase Pin-like site-specific DNA recombinase
MPSPTTEIVGYARVSTDEQSLDLQLDALPSSPWRSIICGPATRSLLVVWKLDRLGRSTHHLSSTAR